MNLQHYVDTRKEAYDDSSSDEYFESPFVVYSKLVDLADTNLVITFDKLDIKNEEMSDTPKLPQRKYAIQVYKKYSGTNIAKFFNLLLKKGQVFLRQLRLRIYLESQPSR
jgi:hypothetical protein